MNKMKDKSTFFFSKLRELYKNGLSKEEIIAALTDRPAKNFKVENTLGNLRKGSIANFVIFSEDLFNKDAMLYENWVNGKVL